MEFEQAPDGEEEEEGGMGQQQMQQQLLMVDSALLDQGGEVEPSQTCPHLHACLRLPLDALPASMARPCQGCGSEAEPWVCLSCGATRCSRYINACAEAHFFESMAEERPHALVLSLSDLSVWCYACGCYVKHDRLLPLLVRAEATKFSAPEKAELLRGAQAAFHVGFSTLPALLRPPPAAAAAGDEGGGKPSPTERAVQGLKDRFLLAKAICCDPADAPDDDDEMVGVVAPLVRALLDEGGGSVSCGLALLGPAAGGGEAAVADAVTRALTAAGRPGAACLLRLSGASSADAPATPGLSSTGTCIAALNVPIVADDASSGSGSGSGRPPPASDSVAVHPPVPPAAAAAADSRARFYASIASSSCPLVVLLIGGLPSLSTPLMAAVLARRLVARALAGTGPPVLVVTGGSEGWGRSAGAAQALLEALLGARAEDDQQQDDEVEGLDETDALSIADLHKLVAQLNAGFGGAGSEGGRG